MTIGEVARSEAAIDKHRLVIRALTAAFAEQQRDAQSPGVAGGDKAGDGEDLLPVFPFTFAADELELRLAGDGAKLVERGVDALKTLSLKGFRFIPVTNCSALGFRSALISTDFQYCGPARLPHIRSLRPKQSKNTTTISTCFSENSGGPVYFSFVNRIYANAAHLGSIDQGVIGLVVEQVNSNIPEFKDLSLDVSRIEPSSYIRDTNRASARGTVRSYLSLALFSNSAMSNKSPASAKTRDRECKQRGRNTPSK